MNEHVLALVRNGVCFREGMRGAEPGKSNRTRSQAIELNETTAKGILKRALQAARTAGAKARRPVHTLKIPGMRRGRRIQVEWEEQTEAQDNSSKLSSHTSLPPS